MQIEESILLLLSFELLYFAIGLSWSVLQFRHRRDGTTAEGRLYLSQNDSIEDDVEIVVLFEAEMETDSAHSTRLQISLTDEAKEPLEYLEDILVDLLVDFV